MVSRFHDKDIRSAILSDIQQLRSKISRNRNTGFTKGSGARRLARAVKEVEGRIDDLRQYWSNNDQSEIHAGGVGMNEEMKAYDMNGDGVIDDAERRIMLEDRRRRMEDEDAQRDSIRKMAWFALFGMLLYPSGIFLCDMFGLNTAASILGDISPTYFVAVSALVASFFGASAYQSKKKD
jgi:hypothetical protein